MDLELKPLAALSDLAGLWRASRPAILGHARRDKSHRRRLMCDEAFRIERPLHCEVECMDGTLWVTQDGDPKDFILEVGQVYRAKRRSPLLIQALGSSASFRASNGQGESP